MQWYEIDWHIHDAKPRMIDAEGTFRDLPGLVTDFTGDFVIPNSLAGLDTDNCTKRTGNGEEYHDPKQPEWRGTDRVRA
jgi:hypothetical protein